MDKKQTQQYNSQTKGKEKPPKPVFVNVNEQSRTSPHVVDLRDDKEYELEDIKAFREKMKYNVERKTIDWVDLMSKDQEKQQMEIKYEDVQTVKGKTTTETTTDSGIKKNQLKALYFSKTPTKVVQFFSSLFAKFDFDFNLKNLLVDIDTSRLRQLFIDREMSFRTFYKDLSKSEIVAISIGVIMLGLLPFPAVGYYKDIQKDSQNLIKKSTQGFSSLQASAAATFSSDIKKAEYNLSEALSAFSQAQSIMNKKHQAAFYIASFLPVVGTKVSAGENILTAGHHFTLGNTYLLKGVSEAKNKVKLPLTERLDILQNHLQSAIPQFEEAFRGLARVPTDAIPSKYRKASEDFKLLFTAMIDDMKDVSKLIEAIQMVFGQDGYRKYLVIFQNNNELRPTGGFAGSFAVVEVQKGEVSWRIPSGGTYDLQGQMDLPLKPPVPIQLVNGKWEFQDSNWWSHLPASAKIMEDMYEEARGSSIDGVITVNSQVLKRVLKVTGPIEHKAFDEPLNSSNVFFKIQQAEERNEQRSKKPKAVLSSLSDKIMKKINGAKNMDLLRLVTQVYTALERKEIQVFMEDKKTQKTLRSFGWSGEILKEHSKQDYLHIVHSNLQGRKSNAKIKESIKLNTEIQQDGTIINRLTLTRKHTGNPQNSPYGSKNISYVRVYAPKGSKLIRAKGFTVPPEEAFNTPKDHYKLYPALKRITKQSRFDPDTGTKISTRFDKTVFGNWMSTNPGGSSKVTLVYKLPFKLKKKKSRTLSNIEKWKNIILSSQDEELIPYSMFIQKQSGTNYSYNHEVHFPNKWKPLWRSTKRMEFNKQKVELDQKLNTDNQYGFVLEK